MNATPTPTFRATNQPPLAQCSMPQSSQIWTCTRVASHEDNSAALANTALSMTICERQLADVELDVEVRIFDPVGLIEPQRHLGEAAAKRRDQMQPGLHQLGQPVEGQRLAALRRVEDAHTADMPVGRR